MSTPTPAGRSPVVEGFTSVRERTEAWEADRLAAGATRSVGAGDRDRPEEPDPLRTAFQRDRDRIVHSTAFRRLKHKTQVFISPDGDHFRTRLTHTLEVAQIARTIARSLALNEDLAEAIALGHDLGHTPFGHLGETVFRETLDVPFHHAEQSVRIVEHLERKPAGLNLTVQVRDGMENSSWNKQPPTTHEAFVVRFADRIAYLNHDIDDAVRAGLLRVDDLPADVGTELGHTSSQRITTLVTDIVASSDVSGPLGDVDGVRMSDEVFAVMDGLRDFLFEEVYLGDRLRPDTKRAAGVLEALIEHYSHTPPGSPDGLPDDAGLPGDPVERRLIDHIALMTDRYALSTYERLFVPVEWPRH